MSILSKLTKLSAATALTVSVFALPAVAQHHGTVKKAGVHKANFKGGKFRGHRGGSFRGRGFRSTRGFNSRGFHGRRGFKGRGFSRRGFHGGGFKGRGFSRRGFHGGGFKGKGFHGGGFHGGFNSGVRHRGFRGNRFHGGGFKKPIVHTPVHAVGGFYSVHSGSIFIDDFAKHGLYAPPRGYRWVCDKGSKDAVLAAVATGAIIAVAADILATPY